MIYGDPTTGSHPPGESEFKRKTGGKRRGEEGVLTLMRR